MQYCPYFLTLHVRVLCCIFYLFLHLQFLTQSYSILFFVKRDYECVSREKIKNKYFYFLPSKRKLSLNYLKLIDLHLSIFVSSDASYFIIF